MTTPRRFLPRKLITAAPEPNPSFRIELQAGKIRRHLDAVLREVLTLRRVLVEIGTPAAQRALDLLDQHWAEDLRLRTASTDDAVADLRNLNRLRRVASGETGTWKNE